MYPVRSLIKLAKIVANDRERSHPCVIYLLNHSLNQSPCISSWEETSVGRCYRLARLVPRRARCGSSLERSARVRAAL
jgi:hypothetical protein